MIERKLGRVQQSPGNVFIDFCIGLILPDELQQISKFLPGWFPRECANDDLLDDLCRLFPRSGSFDHVAIIAN